MNPDLFLNGETLCRWDMTETYRTSIRVELCLPTEVSVVEVYGPYDGQLMQLHGESLDFIAVIRTVEGKDFYTGRFTNGTLTINMKASDLEHDFKIYQQLQFGN